MSTIAMEDKTIKLQIVSLHPNPNHRENYCERKEKELRKRKKNLQP